jgi:hypothetical protein
MSSFHGVLPLLAMAALLSGCFGAEPINEVALELTVAAVLTQTAVPQTQPTLAPTLTPAATPTPEKCLAEVTQNNVNLRRGPDGDIIGCCLGSGEVLEVLEFSADREWARIESVDVPAHRGWVDVRFLRLSGGCEEDQE